jgi:hypothetical protein
MKTIRFTFNSTVRVRGSRIARAFSAALLATLGATVSCSDIELFQDQCATDADCPTGQGCNDGLITKTCELRCSRDEACAADEFCDTDSVFSSFSHCVPGCRVDGQCGGGRICERGICQEGCRVDSQCPNGMACEGTCIPGCRDDSECAAGARCACHQCTEGVCHSDTDCAAGEYCPLGVAIGCTITRCEPLPAPVQCGSSTCHGVTVNGGFGRAAVAPCCVEDACGLDASAVLLDGAGCEPLAQPGAVDESCPSGLGAHFVARQGCRRPDGQCGYFAEDLGLGCVAVR